MTVPPQYQPFPDDEPDEEAVQTPGDRFPAPPPWGGGSAGTAAPPGPYMPSRAGYPPPETAAGRGREPQAAEAGGSPEQSIEPRDSDEVLAGRIGILGPTGCGKTTFLGAIRVALEQRQAGLILGADEESRRFLAEAADRLMRQGIFFNSTRGLSPNYSFQIRIQRKNMLVSTPWRHKRVAKTALVSLDVLDAPGGMFRTDVRDAEPSDPNGRQPSSYSTADRERLAAHLAASRSLILLVDPVREATENDSYDYFQQIILEIAARARFRKNELHLPHHLAVCVTKFDHPLVYNTVDQHGLHIEWRGEQECPWAPPSTAREYFDVLCEEARPNTLPGDLNSTRRLRDIIRQYFSPERTRFFLTSAVGFRTDPRTGRFMSTAPENVTYQRYEGGDREWLLGTARPVNVLEPLMWLVQQQFKDQEKGR
ncbi:hypothetical protein [Actinomadura fibrosa]|uniref:AAA+ ATPase domain-containing protein n=1 Tax=Actinomadura fibrosa TaxID=111802 RepID=A0ABW2XH73_9ACTN|nr:hypothetical protein [Actinomadura fibrosa]